MPETHRTPDPHAPRPALEVPEIPQALISQRAGLSLVWLIPLVAIVVGGWLAYKTVSERGPRIQIELKTAAGLQAGKTKVKFKDVEIGQVTAIDVGPQLDRVIVTAELRHGTAEFLTEHTRFWVERPRVTASRVSGLDTLLSGPYIAIDPVTEGRAAREFIGLEDPPLFTTAEPGKRFLLRAASLGSLNTGSPVYYRQIPVGQIAGYALAADGEAVEIELFVSTPYDALVRTTSRFWNASGIDLTVDATGLQIDTQSLLAVLIGGVAFDTPETIDAMGAPAADGEVFALYPSRDEAHARIYAQRERYLLFFQGSVRGLHVGAPVLLRGIGIGKVLDIQLQFDVEAFQFQIPVLIEIEPERIGVRGGTGTQGPREFVDRLVAQGLRGQLKSASLLTGQLYIDFDFHDRLGMPEPDLAWHSGYQVLPTVPATLDALTTKANDLLARLDRIPLDTIGADLAATMAGASAFFNSEDLPDTIRALREAIAAFYAVTSRVDRTVAPELVQTLARTQATLLSIEQAIGHQSPIYLDLQRTLSEFNTTARAVRQLADYLERHPEALLRGKGGGR